MLDFAKIMSVISDVANARYRGSKPTIRAWEAALVERP